MLRGALPTIAAAVLALGVSACGSASHTASSSGGPVSSVEATELSYISPGAPFVVSVPTASRSQSATSLRNLTGSIPSAGLGIAALKAKLSEIGINYATDVAPVLGNPLMVGAGAPTLSGPTRDDIVAVWVTRSAGALNALLAKIPEIRSTGSYDGAKLYPLGSTELAVDGATIVFAGGQAEVEAALARHAHSAGFSTSEYSRLTSGLPTGAAIQVVGDLGEELGSAKAATARSVPWVGAIRGYGVSVAATAAAVNLGFRVDTSGAALSAAELPLAPGAAPPQLAGSMPITVGVSDPAHVWSFIEGVVRESGSQQFGKFLGDQAKAKTKTGYDLNDIIAQFTGSAIIGSDTHTTIGRVTVSDPSTAAKILAALAKDPSDVLQSALSASSLGNGMYQLNQKSGPPLTLGIVGSQFVIGKGTAGQLRSFASAPASAASGAHGSVAFRIALPQLLKNSRAASGGAVVTTLLRFLGNITGSAQDIPGALTGSATLALNSAG